jgi:copper homeostasis protein
MNLPRPHRTLEVPIDSVAAARVAAPFADRLELCSDLASEGWTPDVALVREVRAIVDPARTSIVAMIRPRLPGMSTALDVAAFTATPAVVEASRREIDASARAGADSVAIGLLRADATIDLEACAALRDHARGFGLVVAFLRTFDLLADRARGMRDLAALGVTRVVTAGVRGWDASVATLDERLATLGADVRDAARAGSAIEIVPGGGVRASNAVAFLRVSPHLHASCRRDGEISTDELSALREVMTLAPPQPA